MTTSRTKTILPAGSPKPALGLVCCVCGARLYGPRAHGEPDRIVYFRADGRTIVRPGYAASSAKINDLGWRSIDAKCAAEIGEEWTRLAHENLSLARAIAAAAMGLLPEEIELRVIHKKGRKRHFTDEILLEALEGRTVNEAAAWIEKTTGKPVGRHLLYHHRRRLEEKGLLRARTTTTD